MGIVAILLWLQAHFSLKKLGINKKCCTFVFVKLKNSDKNEKDYNHEPCNDGDAHNNIPKIRNYHPIHD